MTKALAASPTLKARMTSSLVVVVELDPSVLATGGVEVNLEP